MNKIHPLAFISVISIAILSYWSAYSGSNSTVLPVATTTPATEASPFDFQSVQVDTSDWETYRNEQYGYEFKYPKGWKEVDHHRYLTDKQEIATQTKFDVQHKVAAFANGALEHGPSVGVSSKGEHFGLDELIKENDSRMDENDKLTQFAFGDNTIVMLTQYAKPGTVGAVDNVDDVQVWLITQKNEVFRIDGAHTRDGEYIPEELKYVTGVYRTFNGIN